MPALALIGTPAAERFGALVAKAMIAPWTLDYLNCWFARLPKARWNTTANAKS